MPSNMFSGGSSRMAHNNDDLRERWELRREIAERAKPPRRHHNSQGYADEPNEAPALRAFIGDIDVESVSYEDMPAVIRDLSRKLEFVLELKIELAYKFQSARHEGERRAAIVEQNAAGAAEKMIRAVRYQLTTRQANIRREAKELKGVRSDYGTTINTIRDLIATIDPARRGRSDDPVVIALMAGQALLDTQVHVDSVLEAIQKSADVKQRVFEHISDLYVNMAHLQRYTIWLQAQLAAAHGLDLSMPEEGNE